MILGVFADLHANFQALNAMHKSAPYVDQWVSLGDSVGLYPQVNQVLDWQRLNSVLYVKGDHEEALFLKQPISGSFTASESINKQAKVISGDNLSLLANLQSACDIHLDGLKICATHFLSPESHTTSGKYAMDISILEKKYQGYDFVFFGHTHLPAVLYGRNTVFINPGSAGFPIDVERRCSMVVFNTENRHFDFVRFDYDSEMLIEEIEAANYNPKLISYIRNGHRWI